jgi:hypothetical protein
MILYAEPFVGATAYPTGPVLTSQPSGTSPYSVYPGGWQPEFHTYRVIGGATGSDVLVSFDGKTDHARIPAGATGVLLPLQLPVAYRSVWARVPGGVTAQLACGMYTKQ